VYGKSDAKYMLNLVFFFQSAASVITVEYNNNIILSYIILCIILCIILSQFRRKCVFNEEFHIWYFALLIVIDVLDKLIARIVSTFVLLLKKNWINVIHIRENTKTIFCFESFISKNKSSLLDFRSPKWYRSS